MTTGMRGRAGSERVLVIAAHSDDEVLGCGGTIAAHIQKGDAVRLLFMTNGVGARGNQPQTGHSRKQRPREEGKTRQAMERAEASRRALTCLGVDDFSNLDFPDNRMDTVPLLEIAQAIESQLADFKPDVIYTHHGGDLNVDHRAVHEAVMTACRPQPGSTVRRILAFEVMSSTEWRAPHPGSAFLPNWHQDISATLNDKIGALKCYDQEMRPWPHSRSIKALEYLARHRGACVGLEAAEAFVCARNIVV
jgi:N-acetylglucosamine malate deacetylase 1